MAHELTNDIVDTPAKDRSFWPVLEDFQERHEISTWRDLQQGMYKILQDQGYQKYGPSVVLKMEHEKGLMIFVWVPSSLAYALQNRIERPDYFLNFRMRRSEETVISIMLSSWPNDKQKVFCDLECKTSSIKCKQTIMISTKNSWFQMLLIRTCSERGNFTFFFPELFFYIAADVFGNLFNVSACQFGPHSFF